MYDVVIAIKGRGKRRGVLVTIDSMPKLPHLYNRSERGGGGGGRGGGGGGGGGEEGGVGGWG